jgi:hypothetical protein
MKEHKFIKFLQKSKVLDSRMIAGLCESGFEFPNGSDIITILKETWGTDKFRHHYSEALDASIISVKDSDMIFELAKIASDYTNNKVIDILKLSCIHSDDFRTCGKILKNFCSNMEENQALSYITAGWYSYVCTCFSKC